MYWEVLPNPRLYLQEMEAWGRLQAEMTDETRPKGGPKGDWHWEWGRAREGWARWPAHHDIGQVSHQG